MASLSISYRQYRLRIQRYAHACVTNASQQSQLGFYHPSRRRLYPFLKIDSLSTVVMKTIWIHFYESDISVFIHLYPRSRCIKFFASRVGPQATVGTNDLLSSPPAIFFEPLLCTRVVVAFGDSETERSVKLRNNNSCKTNDLWCHRIFMIDVLLKADRIRVFTWCAIERLHEKSTSF